MEKVRLGRGEDGRRQEWQEQEGGGGMGGGEEEEVELRRDEGGLSCLHSATAM